MEVITQKVYTPPVIINFRLHNEGPAWPLQIATAMPDQSVFSLYEW